MASGEETQEQQPVSRMRLSFHARFLEPFEAMSVPNLDNGHHETANEQVLQSVPKAPKQPRILTSSTRFNVSSLACSFWFKVSPFIRLTFSLDSYLLTDSLVNNNLPPRNPGQCHS